MTPLVLLLLAQSLNLNTQPIESRQAGARLSTQRQYVVDCRTGMTCATDGGVLYLSSSGGTGGSGAPVDGGFVTFGGGTTGSTNERTLTAGTNVTIDLTTPGQVILNAVGGGGSGGNFVSDTVTFSPGKYDATKTVTAAWATSGSAIICVADGEEASVEGLVVTVISKTAGNFTVRAEPRSGRHTGGLPFTCTGL